jgi:hypothetical protein
MHWLANGKYCIIGYNGKNKGDIHLIDTLHQKKEK